MHTLYQLLVNRLKSVILADVGLDLEADFHIQSATRKVELLRQASRFEEEGFTEVAEELRASASTLRPDQPLAQSVPIAAHLKHDSPNGESPPGLRTIESSVSDGPEKSSTTAPEPTASEESVEVNVKDEAPAAPARRDPVISLRHAQRSRHAKQQRKARTESNWNAHSDHRISSNRQ